MMSTETSPSPASRETVSFPAQQVIASNSIPAILEKLKPFMQRTHDESKYPIIIGSRAAAYWLPSFRSFEDWNIVATPNQAYEILESLAVKILKNMQACESSDTLTISLIRQPLDPNVVRRKPMTPGFEAKLDALPDCLYKIVGELKNVIKFEIEIVPVNQDGSLLKTGSSAAILLNICNSDDDQAYLYFPIGPQKCIVASLELLETLKTSHISWPANSAKHIADLHTLRALISPINSNVNIGIRADIKKPLTPPKRTPALEDFLFTRTLETAALCGTPGAPDDLNVSNEDLFERENNLFVTHPIPHGDVYWLIKYGDIPLSNQLKTDSSNSLVSRKLFEEAPYDTQLKCVKEEAMVIALERYLLPKLASDSSLAYTSALIRICTSLTKGWFHQFIVDNFPRLAVCDKDLLSIRDEILEKHPLATVKTPDLMVLLKQSIPSLEELVVRSAEAHCFDPSIHFVWSRKNRQCK